MSSAAVETGVFRPAFERLLARVAARDPAWLGPIRRAAMDRFEKLGFPTTRLEAWRFTPVTALARTGFRPAGETDAPAVTAAALAPHRIFESGAHVAAFVDGRFAPALSSLGALPHGVEVLSLRDVLARAPERVEAILTRVATDPASAFTALAEAFVDDGAVVFLAPGAVVAEPIHLLFFAAGGAGEPALVPLRNLVVAGRGSQATILESHAGNQAAVYFTSAVTEVVLEEAAVLDHYALQRESVAAFQIATLAVRQGRQSRFSDHAVSLGGALARRDIHVLLDGEGSECALHGLFMPRGRQHMDTHSNIVHAQPHCSSREVYKGILDGQARGVFHGKILVEKGAQKTDAFQVNRNLLLSGEALVHSTPAFEIHADDVKCKHGSTTGQLDEAAVFYLRSRGLDEEAARSLLTQAFASEVLRRVGPEPLRVALEAELRSRLPGALEEAAP